jgi:tetratricopeptide (TPR) repeat protein
MSRAVGLIEFNSTLGLVVFFVAIFLIYRMWMQAKLLETTKIFREQLARTDPDFKALQEKIREVGLTPEQAATLLDKGNAIEKGLAVFGEQKFDEAIERFTEGIRETSDAFFYRAIAYFEKGEYFNSLEDWDQLRKLNPTDADALNGSAWILIEKSHDIDKGIKNAEKALALVPNNPNYEDTLAWGFYKKGKYQESLDLLRKAVKKSPNDEEIKRHLTKVESELTATIP